MHWKIIITIIIVRWAYQFYRDSKKPSYRYPSEFEEVIKIIEDTPGAFIHYPERIDQHLYEVKFDVRLYTGKAKGRARLDFEEKDLIMRITYPIPIPEKYMESCYEYIGTANDKINISKWKLELDHRTRLITIVFGTEFEPGIGVLPPYSDHLLKYAIVQMNRYIKGVQKITLEGMTPEEAVLYCIDSNILSR